MLSAPARNSSRAASTAHTVQPHLALALLDRRRRRAGRHRAGRAASRPPPAAAAGERGRAAAGHAPLIFNIVFPPERKKLFAALCCI